MYCDFYQMRERPFNVTADPKFLYLNARYREALASLHYGITQRKGFVTLIGEAGTGKTTLLKKLLDDLDQTTRTVFVFNTNVTFDEILEYIFGEFDLPVHNGKRLYMLQRLNTFLLEELGKGRNVALLIDEAQDLDYSVLEDLRLLSNLETAKEKILQIVLSGQPELGQKLGNPGLRQLRQRVAVNCRLLPLTREELTEYIQARLTAAGAVDPKLFTRDAEERVFEISTGIPRLVNIVCDNALVIGYALGKKRIGADVVNEAAADLLTMETRDLPGSVSEAPAPVVVESAPRGRRMSQLGVVAVVVVALVIGLLSVGRSLLR
ncbi:MAG: ExeA family protein, partial [Candidatus Binatia bacterium]